MNDAGSNSKFTLVVKDKYGANIGEAKIDLTGKNKVINRFGKVLEKPRTPNNFPRIDCADIIETALEKIDEEENVALICDSGQDFYTCLLLQWLIGPCHFKQVLVVKN